MNPLLREANWKDRILFAVGRRKAFRVQGDSMLPTIGDGEVVLISPKASVAAGDIVLAKHPYKESVKILKRIAAIDENGRISVTGDNPDESTDSRAFGTLPKGHIEGKAVCRVK